MCKGLFQEHPTGVLWFMEMKMVLVFWSNSKMMAALYQLAAATVWHGDPIVLHIGPSSTRQVRDYIAMSSDHPSGTSMQASIERAEFQPPPSNPSTDNGLQRTQDRDIQEIVNNQLQEALETIRFMTARREGATPPHGSH